MTKSEAVVIIKFSEDELKRREQRMCVDMARQKGERESTKG